MSISGGHTAETHVSPFRVGTIFGESSEFLSYIQSEYETLGEEYICTLEDRFKNNT